MAIYHVVGPATPNGPLLPPRELLGAESGGMLSYVQVPYEEHMELVYAAADIAVCRAGANTVAELTVSGCPRSSSRCPGAPGDHQTANARGSRAGGAAVLIRDVDLDTAALADELDGSVEITIGWDAWERRPAAWEDPMRRTRSPPGPCSSPHRRAQAAQAPPGRVRARRPRQADRAPGGRRARSTCRGAAGTRRRRRWGGDERRGSVLASMGHRVTGSDLRLHLLSTAWRPRA